MKARQTMELVKKDNTTLKLEQSYENTEVIPRLRRITSEGLYRIAHYLGITVFAVSFTAFIGHLLQFAGLDEWWLYRWYYGDVGMAFNTSIVFMIISATMLSLAVLIRRNEKKP